MNSQSNILIVDDEPSVRRSLAAIFQRSGYNSIIAAGGQEALECLRNGRVDLIILDLQMPGMGGIELLRILQRQYETVPVLILTGNWSLDSIEEATRLGARGYLLKPIDPVTINARINALLKDVEMQNRREKIHKDLKSLLSDIGSNL